MLDILCMHVRHNIIVHVGHIVHVGNIVHEC